MSKIILTVFLLLVLIISGICGCSKPKEQLYIYNWSSYILDDVLREFEKEYNCEIVYDVYSSNEEMFAKLKAGGTGYDIVFPSSSHAEVMIKEGMLDKIDKSKIENYKYLDKNIISKITFDKNSEYFIPYMIGSTGVAVNKKYVKNYKHSWSIFDRTDLKGRMTLIDDMREVIGAGLAYKGYSINTKKEKELQEAKKVVMKWKENIIKFDSESFGKGFANGDFWVVQGYGENIYLEVDDSMKDDIDYFVPEEGGLLWIDGMVVLKDSQHKELACKFINYIHNPQIMAKISDYLHSCPGNLEAEKYKKVPSVYKRKDLERCELLMDIGNSIELYNKIWQEIRVGE